MMGKAAKSFPIILVALVTLHYVRTQGTTGGNRYGNPCHEIYENTSIATPQGKVLCAVPTEDELTEQLKGLGGYNKHYVARTQKEVNENFENLLPWDGEATTAYHYGHPTFRSKLRHRKKKTKAINAKRFPWHKVGEKVTVDEKRVKQFSGFKDERSSTKRSGWSSKVKRSVHPVGIVKSTKVGCISKGQPVGRKQLKQMCDICQRSSELDIDRFPRYINELTCETANAGLPSQDGNSCTYHGHYIGACVQGTMTVDLLRRTDKFTAISPPPSGDYFVAYKQVWEPYTQEIRSCCQCRYP